jgi:hypothetical protein
LCLFLFGQTLTQPLKTQQGFQTKAKAFHPGSGCVRAVFQMRRVSGRPAESGRYQWPVASDQWSVAGDQWLVIGGQWLVTSDQWSVAGDQWLVIGGQWLVTRDQWSVAGDQHPVIGGE